MRLKNKWKLLVFVLLLVIGVGYAALSATLKIAGTSGVKSNKWIIYFDRIQNESGVVSTETKITEDKQEVDFNITLNKPGDYYEFDVDTVNDGTIDAMIDSVEFGELDDSVEELVSFDVTYKDGTEIKKCDLLEKESRKTITVKVKFDDDIKEEDLIKNDTSLNLTFTINYVQKSVCESYPTIIVDPNGGKYNGTKKLTKIKTNKNSDNLLEEPIREGYEFLYFAKTDGTPLEKNENGKTNVHVDNDDVKVIAEWQEDNTTRYTVTIDPNGGFYNASSSNTEVNLAEGETLTLDDPIKEGYIFDSWEEITETNSLSGNIVTMPAANVTVKAIWKTEADYVARINTKYYTTIQKAFDAAVTDDKVYLLKSTTENATNVKDISFDLGTFTVTGTITNSGTLTIDNGRISNTESSPFVNTGTVNVGTHDGNMIADSIVIFGGENVNGLTQNGTFNFYDGYIEGKIAVTDIYNELEEGYYYIVDHDDDNNCQKAYLSPTIDAIVKKMINNKDVYYKLLQDAVDASTNSNPNIYAISNFQDSHETTIGSNQIILLDIAGFTVEEGAAIINNGTLTIKDSAETKGSMVVHEQVVNNGTLNINDISLSQGDTGKNLIENSGNLNITNSTLTALDKYALDIKSGGNLVFDNTTTVTSNSYGIYNESSENVTITGGIIYGIYNNGTNLKVTNSVVKNKSANSIYNKTGILTLENLTATVTGDNRLLYSGTGTVTIIGGSYSQEYSNNGYVIEAPNTNLEITSATITGNKGAIISTRGLVTINSGTITANYSSGAYSAIEANSSTIYVNDGTISCDKCNAIASSGSNVSISGGNINSKSFPTIRQNGPDGVLRISGGTIKSESSNAIYMNGKGEVTGGTIISEQGTAIYIYNYYSRYFNITGGTVIGKVYGIHNTYILTVGEENETVKTDTPVIIGETYGIYSTNTFNFYDGILKGKTAGYYGTVTNIEKGYDIKKDTEEIEEETYNTAYLTVKENYLKVGENTYSSLQKAIDAIETTGTIEVIKNSNENEEATIPSSKTITYDLAGHEVNSTKTITNNGTLTIESSAQGGKYTSSGQNLITNNKTLTIESGNFESTNTVIKVNLDGASTTINDGHLKSTGANTVDKGYNGSTLTVNGGEIETTNSNYSAIYGYSDIKGGYIHAPSTTIQRGANVSGGRIEANTGVALNGSSTISDGTISSVSGTAVNADTVTISGGRIESNTGNAVFIDSNGTISGGNISSINGNAVSTRGRPTITGGTLTSTNGSALYADFYSSPIVSGGTLISENSTAIVLTKGYSVTITGGTIKGKIHGVYENKSSGSIVLGVEDGQVSTTSPVIIGEQEGVHVDSGNFSFYDGIVKGKDYSYSGTVTKIEDSYIVKDDTETIESNLYQIAYLTPETDFLEVNGVTFNSLTKAINAIETTGTIKVIENKITKSGATIPSGKNIVLDLNGKELTTSQPITNEGTLTIEDNDTNGIFSSTASYTFLNKGTLNLNEATYDVSQKLVYGTVNTGVTTVTNATISGIGQVFDVENGTLNITGGTLNATSDNAIYTLRSTLTIDGLTINTSGIGIYSDTSTSNISNTTITSGSYSYRVAGHSNITNCNFTSSYRSAVYSSSERSGTALTITGGTYKGATYGYEQNSNDAYLKSGNFIGGTYGVYVNIGSVTIGTNDENLNIDTPVIQGTTYGIYTVNNPTIYFYDGILKGKTNASDKTIVNIPSETFINYDTETDENDNVYKIAYLLKEVEFIENMSTNAKYKNLNTALTETSNNDELKLIDNGSIFYDVEIPNKKITINLNSKKIDLVKPIVNNGELTITDDSSEKEGKINTSVNVSILENNNKLIIENVELNSSTSSQYAIENTADNVELLLDSVKINLSKGINNTQKVDIANSNINGVITNESGNVSINSSSFNTKNTTLYNYNGIINVSNSSINSTDYGSCGYYNNVTDENIGKSTLSKVNISNDKGYNAINNVNGKLEINNKSNLLNAVDNSGTLTIDNSTIGGEKTTNSGTLIINNYSTLNCYVISNSGTLSGNNSTFNITKNGGTIHYIENTSTGNMTLNSSTVNATNTRIIAINSGTLNINSTNITSTGANANDRDGINNSGTLNFNSSKLYVTTSNTSRGVYSTGGVTSIKDTEIKISNAKNAYGVYVENGAVFIGELEDPLDVSTTSPIITAIGSTAGIGIKKTSGQVYFYDGIITGSTEAIPEAPTDIPNRYRIVLQSVPNDNNYDVRILEYVP